MRIFTTVVLGLLLILGIGKAIKNNRGTGVVVGSNPPSAQNSGNNPTGRNSSQVSIKLLTSQGGRVAWYHGSSELIAYDAIVNDTNKNTELFIMNPDGSGKACVTCNSVIPKGFVGQPDWYADGEYILLQAENANSKHGFYNHMAWGFDNDLWIIKKDGSGAEKIWSTPKGYAVLHPHFSQDGTKIIFAEHVPTGKKVSLLGAFLPGGESPWDGWQIHIADFDMTKSGTDKLSNHRILFAGTGGFYETHSFSADGKQIIYSHTKGGLAYIDDGYIANSDGTNIRNLTNSPTTWDEHANFSPSGAHMAFMSSRADATWVAPKSKANTLRTELYVMDTQTGKIQQLTNFNQTGDPNKNYLVSDFDWNKDGTRIVLQVAPVDKKTYKPDSPKIYILTFPEKK